MEAAAMPKHSKTHKKSDGAAVETVPLQLDLNSFVPARNIRPLENASISPWTYKYASIKLQWTKTVEWSFNHRIKDLSLLSLHPQHLPWWLPVPPGAVGGSLFAARLSGLTGCGGSEPGVQTYLAPGAGAAEGQVCRCRGRAQLPLQIGIPPHRCGLHLCPTHSPHTPTMKTRSVLAFYQVK